MKKHIAKIVQFVSQTFCHAPMVLLPERLQKKCFINGLIICIILLGSCNTKKDLIVGTPDFNIKGYTVQDAQDNFGNPIKEVVFQFEGNADVISFFSGEPLKEYAYKDGRIIGIDAVNVSFEYVADMGDGTDPTWKQLFVMATTNFDGTVTEEGEGWIDITDRFNIPMAKDFTTRTLTSADISDLLVPGQPLYIGFKYITYPRSASAAYTTWDIHEFKISVETLLGSEIIYNQRVAAFPLYHFGPDDASDPSRTPRSTSTTSRLRFRANVLAANRPFTAGDWAIAPPIVVDNEINLGPDRPVGIKNRIDPALSNYTYVYDKPGTYKATFVATNITSHSEASVVKEIEITIP